MAERKKKKRRHSELEQFVPTASGQYIYTGEYMVFEGTKSKARHFTALRLGLGLLLLFLLLTAGFLPAGGMKGSFYVLLPYALAILAAGMAVYGALRAAQSGKEMRLYIYEKTILTIPRRSLAAALLSALTATGEVLYMFLAQTVTFSDFAVLGLTLAAAGSGLILWQKTKREQWKIREKK